ncbi:hypothetical protein D3C84_1048190 [compost metagenome]
MKLWMGLVMPKRQGSAGSSSTKVPNSLSQMISTPAKLRSIYLGLLAWCTLWWEGVLKMASSQPSLPTTWVWTKN